jgi:hypothetical protein
MNPGIILDVQMHQVCGRPTLAARTLKPEGD